MARIESAYFGDDLATRNITESLRKRVTGGKLDVTADSTLIPAFEAAPETKLETQDEKKIREQAVAACGESNQRCMETTRARLRQEKLQEKERQSKANSEIVKGRRLTLNIVDKDGKRRTLIAPDGQKLTVDNVDGGEMTSVGGVKLPSASFFTAQFGNLSVWFVVGLVQAFGLAAFVMMLRDEAPLFWERFVINGGNISLVMLGLLSVVLLALPFGPLGLVVIFYIAKGIYNEFKK